MATIHHKIRFEVPPKLEDVRKRVCDRTGLTCHLGLDSIDPGHEWPELGIIREAGSLECDDAGDSDLDLTVGQHGVRLDVVPGTNLYFRDVVLAVLQEMGGKPDHKPSGCADKPWARLSEQEKNEAVH